MKYRLYREHQLHCDLKTAWRFFSSAQNLSKITPKKMKFEMMHSQEKDQIYQGLIIDYKVSPLWGIPWHWQTLISQVEYQKSFTDIQQKGPYKSWKHLHEFIPNAQGVLMKDTVEYELPYGLLGDLVHALVVKNKLRHIFDYRKKVLEKIF